MGIAWSSVDRFFFWALDLVALFFPKVASCLWCVHGQPKSTSLTEVRVLVVGVRVKCRFGG